MFDSNECPVILCKRGEKVEVMDLSKSGIKGSCELEKDFTISKMLHQSETSTSIVVIDNQKLKILHIKVN